jgi:hypothetical protein
MPTGTAKFGVIISGLLTGSKTVAVQAALATAVSEITDVNNAGQALLQSGDNTVTVPTGATLAIISFPVTPNTVTWKGAGGDTGTQMIANPAEALFAVMLVSGLSSFILNASALTTGVEISFV